MIANFVATEAGTEEDAYFIATGVACADPPHHLMFMRSLPIGSDEDWGIEIEYDDQINSGYDKINRCVLKRSLLRVELIEPIDRQMKYTGFKVELRVSDSQWNLLADDLGRVFTGREERLLILDVLP